MKAVKDLNKYTDICMYVCTHVHIHAHICMYKVCLHVWNMYAFKNACILDWNLKTI
jgi:hypothetical protein